jgi:hypothetical protein
MMTVPLTSTQIKQARRAAKEAALAAKQLALPDRRYGVTVADPPWRWEPYSITNGVSKPWPLSKKILPALFKNEDRVTDNQPNTRGRCKIDGKDYFVSAWTKLHSPGSSINPWRSSQWRKTGSTEKGKSDPASFDNDVPF